MDRFTPRTLRSAGIAPRGELRTRPGLFVLLLLCLCASLTASAQEQTAPTDVRLVVHQPYRICCGDTLEVVYALRTNVYRTMGRVRTDGMISLPLVDDVRAAGRRLDELSVILREKYSVVYRHPKIDVILRHSVAARAFVGGMVNYAGIISLRIPITARQALIMAGGVTEHGAMSRVVVVRKKNPTDTVFFELDLTDKEASLTETGMFYLEPGDLVLVPMKNVSKLRLWIQQYVYKTLALALTTDFAYVFRLLNFENILFADPVP